MILTILAAVAQFEWRDRREGIRDAARAHAAAGPASRRDATVRPNGLDPGENGKPMLALEPTEQAAIARMWAMRRAGATLMVSASLMRSASGYSDQPLWETVRQVVGAGREDMKGVRRLRSQVQRARSRTREGADTAGRCPDQRRSGYRLGRGHQSFWPAIIEAIDL